MPETNSPAPDRDDATLIREALVKLRTTRARLEQLEYAAREPIAVVGMSCRFPGAEHPADFWRLLDKGHHAIREVPSERWDIDRFFDADPEAPGKICCRHGGFLDQPEAFDPHFFGISPHEAVSMDPQQRLLLELAWEALEDAHLVPAAMWGSNSGVFLGISGSEYFFHRFDGDLRRVGAYTGSGNALSVAAGRLAYKLGFNGPCMAIDTACSSSLVALDAACRSLRSGTCDLALSAGVNLIFSPLLSIAFSKAGMLAPGGLCRTFDAAAEGYVRGEGGGVLVLKRLSDAQAAGDSVLALIRGSAVNQDGASGGLTVPNGPAQETVIRRALAQAGVTPADVDYVEAHGTATVLGDPIEAAALGRIFGERRSPLRIGSVKTNIGHLEAAAGIAGIIKAILALVHERIPASLHFETPNPRIPWNELPLEVVAQSTPWHGEGRLVGVSSFGFSGTNSHVVLAPAPTQESPTAAPDWPYQLLTVSAADQESLKARVSAFADALRRPAASLSPIAYTANARRSHFPHRVAIVAADARQAADKLDALLAARPAEHRPAEHRPVEHSASGLGQSPARKPGPALESVQQTTVRELAETPPEQPDKLAVLAELYVAGAAVDWQQLYGPAPRQTAALPPYPFHREVFRLQGRGWTESDAGPASLSTSGEVPLHPLVGSNTSTLAGLRFTTRLDDTTPFLADHRVAGRRVLPAAGIVEMARAAGALAGEHDVTLLRDIVLVRPIIVDDGPRTLHISLEALTHPDSDRPEQGVGWRIHGDRQGDLRDEDVFAEGRLEFGNGATTSVSKQPLDLDALRRQADDSLDGAECYRRFAEIGLSYGPSLQVLQGIWRRGDQALGRIELAPDDAFGVSPALLDGALQTVMAFGDGGQEAVPWLPFAFAEIRLLRPAEATTWVRVTRAPSDGSPMVRFDLQLTDAEGRLCVDIRGFAARPMPAHSSKPRPQATQRAEVRDASPGATQPLKQGLLNHFQHLLARTTGYAAERIDPLEPLEGFGIDSVMILGLTRDLETDFGELPKTLFFEVRNLDELTQYFLDKHLDTSRALVQGAVSSPSATENPPAIAEPTAPGSRRAVSTSDSAAWATSRRRERRDEDIAILGVAGRYPQAANLDQLWNHLTAGRDCITEIPARRWNHDAYFDPNPNHLGKSYGKWGSFLDEVDRFDPLFFNISPREAQIIDPQERLFLETVWHTLEDAGQTRAGLADQRVGVYVGVMWGQYQLHHVNDGAGHVLTPSSSFASIANRVSYVFDFRGPSLALDTMCSSSLTAIHLACESLRRGETDVAVAGGVNLSLHPHKYVQLSLGRFLASDGRCRSFGVGGDGYVPGEGVGAVLLRPLAAAEAAGDRILAVIKASALNHGGRTHGYSVPNPRAQGDVIREAIERSGIDPGTLGYIEAHGTGTALGDPIEIAGLEHALSAFDLPVGSCSIGSLKSNLGHLESAAAIAGLTKVLLQMRHQQLVPSIHSQPLNPHLDLSASPLQVQQRLAPWPRPTDSPRRAGLSSFGAGGANGHLVIEAYEPPQPALPPNIHDGPQLAVLSARDDERLREMAAALDGFLAPGTLAPADVAWTLQVGREAMNDRLAIVFSDLESLRRHLRAFHENGDTTSPEVWHGRLERVHGRPASDPPSTPDDGPATHPTGDRLADVAQRWIHGENIAWHRLHGGGTTRAGSPPNKISLPGYSFARQRCWVPDLDALTAGLGTAPSSERRSADAPDPPTMEATSQSRPTAIAEPTVAPSISNDLLFVRRDWQPVPLEGKASPMAGPLLVFTDSQTTRREAFSSLRGRGDLDVVRIYVGETGSPGKLTAEALDADDLILDAGNAEHYERLMEVLDERRAIPRQALFDWCRSGALDLDQHLERGVFALLHFTQALLRRSLPGPFRGVFVASGDPDASPALAALPAWAKSVAFEQPSIRFRWLALPPEMTVRDRFDKALDELQAEGGAHEARVIDGQRHEPVLREIAHSQLAEPWAPTDGEVFLITGGLGGLGLLFGRHLARHHGAKLVLCGRSSAEVRSEDLEALRDLGAEVHYVQADVGEAAGAAAVVAAAHQRFGALDGILHAAGVLRDGLLARKSIADMQQVLAPKVHAASHLLNACRENPPKVFVLFSSITALTGNLGQSDYAFANAFMDALARQEHHRNRTAEAPATRFLAIDWPLWQEGGMGVRPELVAMMERSFGVRPLSTEHGVDALLRGLATDLPHMAVLEGEVSTIRRVLGVTQAENAPPLTTPTPQEDDAATTGSLGADPVDDLPGFLRAKLSQVLDIEPQHLDDTADLRDLGVDSIFGMQLLAEIETRLGLRIYPNELEEHNTLARLVEYLENELAEHGTNAVPSANGSGTPAATERQSTENRLASTTVDSAAPAVRTDVQASPQGTDDEVMFLLSTPRAGSTLLRVLLMGHDRLFAPPELHLLPFDSLAQRAAFLHEHNQSYLREGLIETLAVLEGLDPEAAGQRMQQLETDDLAVPDVYELLHTLTGDRRLVDKSPSYGVDPKVLQRAEALGQPFYLFLIRHPLAVMASFVTNRFHKLLGVDEDPWLYAERLWRDINTNIRDFLETIPARRQAVVRYEDLVRRPQQTLEPLCRQLGLAPVPGLLQPYAEGRMTHGLHDDSMTIGDPNFLRHDGIDPTLADAWQPHAGRWPKLAATTRRLALDLGFEPPPGMNLGIAPAQRSFLERRAHDPRWHMVQRIGISGVSLDRRRFEHAWQQTLQRHPALRVRFLHLDDAWQQQLHAAATGQPTEPLFENLEGLDAEALSRRRQAIEADLHHQLNIEHGPLLGAAWTTEAADQHELLLVVHHLVADGLGLNLLTRSLLDAYRHPDAPPPAADLGWPRYLTDLATRRQQLLDDDSIGFWQDQLTAQPSARQDAAAASRGGEVAQRSVLRRDIPLGETAEGPASSERFFRLAAALYRSLGALYETSTPILAHRLHRRDLGALGTFPQTVGWFAGDVVLTLPLTDDPADDVSAFRRRFGDLPEGGLSYEIGVHEGLWPATHQVAEARLNFQPKALVAANEALDVRLWEPEDHAPLYALDLVVREFPDRLWIECRSVDSRCPAADVQRLVTHWLEQVEGLDGATNDGTTADGTTDDGVTDDGTNNGRVSNV